MMKTKSKNAFTLIELLVVIAVIAILAALLMPALNRARKEAKKVACKANLHNIALGIATFRESKNGNYPIRLDPDVDAGRQWSNAWGRLYYGGHLDNLDVFNCPNTPKAVQLRLESDGDPHPKGYSDAYAQMYGSRIFSAERNGAVSRWQTTDVLNSDYGYDNARIDRNSNPSRVMAGDLIDRAWRENGLDWAADPTINTDIFDQEVNANHEEGCSVAFVDHSVSWIEQSFSYMWWVPEVTAVTGLHYNGSTIEYDVYPPLPCTGDNTDYVREGIYQNPRLEEDQRTNDGDVNDDHDDIYAIELETAHEWEVPSPFAWATGVSEPSQDHGHPFNMNPYGSRRPCVLLKDSKIDASLGAYADYMNGMGWPDTIRVHPSVTLEYPYWDESPY